MTATLAAPVAAAALAFLQPSITQSANALVIIVARLAGLAVFAGLVAAVAALGYRWYVRERIPSGLALLLALAGVAVVLNTTRLLAAELTPGSAEVEVLDALFHIVAFLGAAGGAYGGMRVGDRIGIDLFASSGTGEVDGDLSRIVQSVGRVTTVRLPEDIEDVVGYDPVAPATKEDLAGRRFLFPRRLTVAELRERLVSRLKTDYGVGHVDVEFADDGSVAYLALGSRAAGIGPTLPPATNAVAIRADPAHAASAGDLVQVWETDPLKRVLTGELRGVAGDVATVAIDAADTPKLNPTEEYKLVTLPVEDRPDREFASLLRAADETLATITVEAGSELAGAQIGSLEATVAAITREDAQPVPLPEPSRTLEAGDVVYAIATPDVLRRVEAAARGTGDAVPADADSDDDDAGGDGQATESEASTVDESTPADAPTAEGAPGTDPGSEAANGDAMTQAESGDAFPDADDLPGIDPAEAASSLTDDDSDEVLTHEDDVTESAAEPTETDEESAVPAFDVGEKDPLADPLAEGSSVDAGWDAPSDDEGSADVDAYAFDDDLGGDDELDLDDELGGEDALDAPDDEADAEPKRDDESSD